MNRQHMKQRSPSSCPLPEFSLGRIVSSYPSSKRTFSSKVRHDYISTGGVLGRRTAEAEAGCGSSLEFLDAWLHRSLTFTTIRLFYSQVNDPLDRQSAHQAFSCERECPPPTSGSNRNLPVRPQNRQHQLRLPLCQLPDSPMPRRRTLARSAR